jgi:hypothetical protein
MLNFFKVACIDPSYSKLWRVCFFSLKYLQNIVLLTLFFNGVSDINNIKNLAFMIFFVVFTAYEKLYRKFAFILTISICIPIFV